MVHKRSLPTQFNPLLAPEKTPAGEAFSRRERCAAVAHRLTAGSVGIGRATSPWTDKACGESTSDRNIQRDETGEPRPL